MKSSKKIIIVISIILILAIVGAIFAYLFLMTDILKSNQELFVKYFEQNTQMIQKITNLQAKEILETVNGENKYESNTNIDIIHSEGGEVSHPLNNLNINLDIQKDEEEQYLYADGKILYNDEEYLEAEVIKQEELYGIRFTDAIRQFITIKNDEKIDTIAEEIGITTTQLETLINILDGTEPIIVTEQINTLTNKYSNIIKTAVLEGTFSKQKDVIITYNDVATEVNAYSVEMSSQQVQNMMMKILDNAEAETEILEILPIEDEIEEKIDWVNNQSELPIIKVTVYEQEQNTIRTTIKIGEREITIENSEQSGETNTKIDYVDNNQSIQIDMEIIKQNLDNQEILEVTADVSNGEESYTIAFSGQIEQLEDQIVLNAEISHIQDITTKTISLENIIILGADFEKNQIVDSENSVILNDYQEEIRVKLIETIKQLVQQDNNERIDLLKRKLSLINEEAVDDGTTQVEINKFNSRFEFYTGDEVSAENVKMLLDIVKNNLVSYETIEEESQEDDDNTSDTEEMDSIEDVNDTYDASEDSEKMKIKLNIEKDTLNEDAVNQILEEISDNKKYEVLIFYKEANGLIDYITITEK